MRSVNKAILIGNVGGDPEIRTFDSGDRVASVSLATSRKWKNRDGEEQEKTEWHRLNFRGGLVDVVESYVKKGDALYIEGEINYRSYEDQDGNTKYITEIFVREMNMLGSRSGGGEGQESAPAKKGAPKKGGKKGGQASVDDELPF